MSLLSYLNIQRIYNRWRSVVFSFFEIISTCFERIIGFVNKHLKEVLIMKFFPSFVKFLIYILFQHLSVINELLKIFVLIVFLHKTLGFGTLEFGLGLI